MTRQELEYRAEKNGMIDYDHYRSLATHLRREAITVMLHAALAALAGYFRLPQNRWMRRQASSRSSVRVA